MALSLTKPAHFVKISTEENSVWGTRAAEDSAVFSFVQAGFLTPPKGRISGDSYVRRVRDQTE